METDFILRNAALEIIIIPHSKIERFLREGMKLFSYKRQMNQRIKNDGKVEGIHFALYCRNALGSNHKILKRMTFFEEYKISLSGKVKKQNCRMWGPDRSQQV